ncbi:beta-alanine-activating enzyme-like [Octopus sinensis]|uniref:Beta-alanine-activating enzyme-like n=1 Tax=Octopus sinensis TaxID=2607531 RepID=A0A6P7TVK9_9MOLL|nr:beta-alanine-activating enzyme-like [Octopus sinensis]
MTILIHEEYFLNELDCTALPELGLLPDISCVHYRHSTQTKQSADIAYAITTSGSTAQPKIIRVPFDCIMPNILDFRNILNIEHGDVVLLSAPLTFDPSIVDMFCALSGGGSLLVVGRDLLMRPSAAIPVLLEAKVSIMQPPPGVREVVREPGNVTQIFNLYGITEVSAWSTIFEIPANWSGDIPVGLEGQVFSTPLWAGNSIYIGCRDNHMYKINIHL